MTSQRRSLNPRRTSRQEEARTLFAKLASYPQDKLENRRPRKIADLTQGAVETVRLNRELTILEHHQLDLLVVTLCELESRHRLNPGAAFS